MHRARRSAYVFFRLGDEVLPDIGRLLGGEVDLVRQIRLFALSALTGREYGISLDELRLLSTLPGDRWTDVGDLELDDRPVTDQELRGLALAGLVLVDGPEEELARLRGLDERLTATGWNPHAVLYHAFSKWRDVDVGELAVPADTPARRGVPGAFHAAPRSLARVELPLVKPANGLFHLLLERRTTRGFDLDTPVRCEELALLLYYTFGCQGFMDLGDIVVLRKTSPSGGSLHPIEAYPLVLDVDGVEPGLYHYRADRHELELLEHLQPDAARALLVEFAAGQTYLATASVLLVLTARFDRAFWKYRNPRAYAVLHMDAAHITQTLYLVAAELQLGAFVSAAVNAGNIEERLGLDGFREGAVAVCGVGHPARRRSPYEAEFAPYVPRKTFIDPD